MRWERWGAVAVAGLLIAIGLNPVYVGQTRAIHPGTYDCGPAEDLLALAKDEGKTIVEISSDISQPSVTVPKDEVWLATTNVTVHADTSMDILGSLLTERASDGQSPSLQVEASSLTVDGNLSTASGANGTDVTTTVVDDGNTTRKFVGEGGGFGGDLVLDVGSLTAYSTSCISTGAGGAGAPVLRWDTDTSNQTEDEVYHEGGEGGRGGHLITYEDLTDELNGTRVWLGNGSDGGKVITNGSYPPPGNRTISGVGGEGGHSALTYGYARTSSLSLTLGKVNFAWGADPSYSDAVLVDVVGDSGSGGPGGGALVPLGEDWDESEVACMMFTSSYPENPCAGDPSEGSCSERSAPDGQDGGTKDNGNGQDGWDGPDGNDANDARASGGDGDPGMLHGRPGGNVVADACMGVHGGNGGRGGDASTDDGDGGKGGEAGTGGAGGSANATGGRGGDGSVLGGTVGRGGDGGLAEAYGGFGGDAGRGGHGGNGGCGSGVGGDGGGGKGWIGGFGGHAEATGGDGGDGAYGGSGGDARAVAEDAGNSSDGGNGGDGDTAGEGWGGATENAPGGDATAGGGSGGTGTIENGPDGTVLQEEDGSRGDYGDPGDDGSTC